jgi:hypothetical protein
LDITLGSEGRFVSDPVQVRKKAWAHEHSPAGDVTVIIVQIPAEKGKTKQIVSLLPQLRVEIKDSELES